MRAGRTRHRVTIQQPTADEPWGKEVTYKDYTSLWASIEPLRGEEYFAAQQINAEITTKIVARYQRGIVPKMRAVFKDRIFEIIYVVNPDERNRELQLMVKELIQ